MKKAAVKKKSATKKNATKKSATKKSATKKSATRKSATKKSARTTTFDDTDKATRPAWTAPGAWTFVYETGASRSGKLAREERDAPYVVDEAVRVTLRKGETATWRHDDRDVSLQRTHFDVIRLMVGEWEESFSSTAASGGGATVFVAHEGAPLILVLEQAGLYRRLIEINPN